MFQVAGLFGVTLITRKKPVDGPWLPLAICGNAAVVPRVVSVAVTSRPLGYGVRR
jgi:hypothetical protein